MAKELPYFKFEPNQWENGNIQMLSREDKGLFIDLCTMYWSRLGDVPLKLAIQKLCNGNATALNSLCEENIIELIDENIYIKFLSEQLNEFENISEQNSKNAKEGWEKRRKLKGESERNATALNSQSENDAIREDKSKKDKSKKDNIPTFVEFLSYALEKEPEICEIDLKRKYESWLVNNWKDGNDKKITNWKTKLINTLKYLDKKKEVKSNKYDGMVF